ncbi:MAG TPA: hypothetical protein VFJ82_12275 [Longimicrobium sp.]|nr:hypothetical protein [Longimicrobium sp.]
MDTLTAKARGILLRLPHFYHPDGAGKLLVDVVDGVGTALERAETDLYRVLRSHHVQTADNDATGGFTAPPGERGDLDRILALYLEELGGTSQLVKVSPAFTARSIDTRRLARRLAGREPLAVRLRAGFAGATLDLLRRFDPAWAGFRASEILPGLVLELLLAPANLAAVREPLSAAGRAWLDRLLAPADRPALESTEPDAEVLADLWARLPAWSPEASRVPQGERARTSPLPYLLRVLLALQVRERLDPPTRRMLERYDGGEVAPATAAALAHGLNERVLADPQLYPRNRALFDLLAPGQAVLRLRGGVYRDLLRARAGALDAAIATAPEDERPRLQAERDRIGAELEWADVVPAPPGDDLVRLNRMLLEAAWPFDATERPWGPAPRDIPPVAEVRDALVDELNGVLGDAELADPAIFPELAGEIATLRTRHGGRTDWLNRTLLEHAWPEAIEPAHAAYRERLLGLIQVLRRGASTRRGIVDVVAANLGILGNDRDARAARELIRIVEYAPERMTFYAGQVEFWGEFEVHNPNPDPAAEAEFRLTVLPGPPAVLANVRLTSLDAGESVEWPGRLGPGDKLTLRGGTVLLNGIAPPETLSRPVPAVPTGDSLWRFDADVVVRGAEARLDKAWPVGRFDGTTGSEGMFDRAVLAPSGPMLELEVASEKTTPGTFTVAIPWNIPGFTDRFEPQDHPRDQILGLVRRVKAAGVEARVSYHERFREDHAVEVALRLILRGRLLAQVHEITDAWSAASRQRGREVHDTADNLVLSGMFDHTRFDSLNTFA